MRSNQTQLSETQPVFSWKSGKYQTDIQEYYDLVGGWATPLRNMKVTWADSSQYMEKIKKSSKPPTSYPLVN